MNRVAKWVAGSVLSTAFSIAALLPIEREVRGSFTGYRGESDRIVSIYMTQPDGALVSLDVRGLNLSEDRIQQAWEDQNHTAEIKTNRAEILWNKVANFPAGDYGLHTISLK